MSKQKSSIKEKAITLNVPVMRSSKLLVPHSKKCAAVRCVKEGTWETEWSGCIEESYFGNINAARKRGHSYWHVITCNDSRCKGRKAVNAEVLNFA